MLHSGWKMPEMVEPVRAEQQLRANKMPMKGNALAAGRKRAGSEYTDDAPQETRASSESTDHAPQDTRALRRVMFNPY